MKANDNTSGSGVTMYHVFTAAELAQNVGEAT